MNDPNQYYFIEETAHFGVEVYRQGKRSPYIRARLYIRTNVICGPERRYEITGPVFGGEYGRALQDAFDEAKKWALGELRMCSDELEHLQSAVDHMGTDCHGG